METKFQTSFIPKAPITSVGGAGTNFASHPKSHGSLSIFFSIGVLLFIVSLGLAGGVYAWKGMVVSSQTDLKQQLADKQKQFNPNLIEDLKGMNIKIDLAKKLMDNHLALSRVFPYISQLTTERVRFKNLDLTAPGSQSSDVKITMQGMGADLSAVAFQSDVFGSLDQYGLRKIVKNPIMSDPTLEANGSVSFGFSASIDPSALLYLDSLTNPVATSTAPF